MGRSTHGLSHTRSYQSWRDMMRRCFDPKAACYANYGGRGITVAPSLRIFQGFYALMGEPDKGMTLDRKDSNLGYFPENMRWLPKADQNRNKRNNDRIEYRGQTMTLTEWARTLDIPQRTLWCRLYRHGWSVELAFTAKRTRITNRKLTQTDRIFIMLSPETSAAIAARLGVAQSTVSRVRTGKRWGNPSA